VVGAFREPSCGRRVQPIHSIPYSVALPLERGLINYYSIIQGGFCVASNIKRPHSDAEWYCRKDPESERFYETFFGFVGSTMFIGPVQVKRSGNSLRRLPE
jgi:hypothetical protein